MWWISYRGEGKSGVDNIGVFEDDGTPRKEHPLLLDPSPDAHPLHIARGFALVGDDLYIANAWRKDSHVVRYRRHGDTFHFADLVVTTQDVAAMVHPFDIELGDDGRLYVSCQDTNTGFPTTDDMASVKLRGQFQSLDHPSLCSALTRDLVAVLTARRDERTESTPPVPPAFPLPPVLLVNPIWGTGLNTNTVHFTI